MSNKVSVIIHYAPNQSKKMELPSDQTVRDAVTSLVYILGLPEYDISGKIIYTFYLPAQILPDIDGYQIGEILQDGDHIVLSSLSQPWMMIEPSYKQMQTAPCACLLHIHGGNTYKVCDRVKINRQFILDNLSLIKRFRIRNEDTILKVSRKTHCEIFQKDYQWFVRAHEIVQIDDRIYKNHETIPLDSHAILYIGRYGWRIDVKLIPVE